MQIIEAALAFAITMLVLSLICSSFVEMIHRAASLREAGLKYMLYQMFDQVLEKYIKPAIKAKVEGDKSIAVGSQATAIEALLTKTRDSFVKTMSANRAPAELRPKTGQSDPVPEVSLASLTAAQFMERLGSAKLDSGVDVADIIKKANEAANTAAGQAGAAAANAIDAVLKDVAQKFEAFGSEISEVFQRRARWISVSVAIVLAFAIRVDAIELLNTYLRDPNARNNVIEQAQAVTAQYRAAKEAAESLQKISNANPPPADDVKLQIEALKKEWQATVDNTRKTVKQYSDLGLPIGWTKQNATLNPWAITCKKDGTIRVVDSDKDCVAGEQSGTFGCGALLRLIASLLLGGILIGLGAPFWYDAVTGLTNIRDIAKDVRGTGQRAPAGGTQPGAAQPGAPATPDRPQPVTPVGAFTVAQVAAAAAK